MILILLTILKITGIILLVLLGLIILLLCLILFAPVKYRAKGAKHPDEMSVNAFISYLRPILRVRVIYPSDTMLSVKILWFDLLNPKKKKSKKKNCKKEKAGAQHGGPAFKTPQEDRPAESDVYPLDSFTYESRDQQPKPEEKERVKNKEENRASSKGKSRSTPPSKEKTENKLAAIAALLWQYKEMYPDVLGRVFHALKSILPRKCNIHLIFGTGSPDQTGYLYGAYCALQEYLPGTIVFEPVWMESYLDVEFDLSGNIRLIHFVTAAVKIIADKRVRNFISEIRRL